MKLIIAEKPSVAQTIAAALGVTAGPHRRDGPEARGLLVVSGSAPLRQRAPRRFRHGLRTPADDAHRHHQHPRRHPLPPHSRQPGILDKAPAAAGMVQGGISLPDRKESPPPALFPARFTRRDVPPAPEPTATQHRKAAGILQRMPAVSCIRAMSVPASWVSTLPTPCFGEGSGLLHPPNLSGDQRQRLPWTLPASSRDQSKGFGKGEGSTRSIR